MRFSDVQAKHEAALREAYRDLCTAQRDDVAALGVDATRMHRALKGLGEVLALLPVVAEGEEPWSYTPD